MTDKKQAVFLRIPGHTNYDPDIMQKMTQEIQKMLQHHFEKEVVVLMYNEDIQFVGEGEIRSFIEQLENILK